MASGSSRARGGASKAIGKIQAAQILAAGFGPLLGGTLASYLSIRAAFWGASLSCLFATLVVWAFYEDDAEALRAPVAESAPLPVDLPRGFFAALVFVVFFVNFASRSFTPILPAQLESFGVAHSSLAISTGILISVYSVAAAASSFAFGRMAATAEPVPLIVFSLLSSLFAAAAMAYAGSFETFLAIALVYGLVSGGGLTLGYSIGSRRFPEASRGASFGKLSGAALIGGAVAPALAALAARSSLANVYWMNALIYALLIGTSAAFLRAPARAD
jgi:DHA1 family multidrug resistance protein-like MFS transporter